MSDFVPLRSPADHSRINLLEEGERRWWTKQFGVTEEHLTEAVDAVGTKLNDISKYLELWNKADAKAAAVRPIPPG